MLKPLRMAGAAGACLGLLATAALAQAAPASDTLVHIPIGDWIGQGASILLTLAGAVLAFALAKLPASIVAMIKTAQVDQLLLKAIDYGINAVAGAEKGKTLDIDVGNAVLEKALQYVIDHAPAWLIQWMGGDAMVREKLVARLPLAKGAAVS